MNYTEILTQIQGSINWIVFALVIASGYFVRATPILKKHSTTSKLLLFSFVTVALYVYFAKVDVAVAIASYFITVGFHTLIIKQLERRFIPSERVKYQINLNSKQLEDDLTSDIVGGRPGDREKKG